LWKGGGKEAKPKEKEEGFMAEQKRRWGDRRDATLLRDVDSLHFIMGIIYPNRADNEAYIAERVNLEPIKDCIADEKL